MHTVVGEPQCVAFGNLLRGQRYKFVLVSGLGQHSKGQSGKCVSANPSCPSLGSPARTVVSVTC